jgi:hypothetical protein
MPMICWQQTPLAQSAASLHPTCSAPEAHVPPLYAAQVSALPPSGEVPRQQYSVAVLHELPPHGTVPGSHAAPPSGAWHDGAPPLLPLLLAPPLEPELPLEPPSPPPLELPPSPTSGQPPSHEPPTMPLLLAPPSAPPPLLFSPPSPAADPLLEPDPPPLPPLEPPSPPFPPEPFTAVELPLHCDSANGAAASVVSARIQACVVFIVRCPSVGREHGTRRRARTAVARPPATEGRTYSPPERHFAAQRERPRMLAQDHSPAASPASAAASLPTPTSAALSPAPASAIAPLLPASAALGW